MQEKTTAKGNLKISNEVVSSIVEYSIKDLGEVASIEPVSVKSNLFSLLESQSIRPISVELKDGVAKVNVRLLVGEEVKIRQFAKKLQSVVKESIQNMTGIVVSDVNICIAGLIPQK